MKIDLMSDIHLEFGYHDTTKLGGEVLVLAGDIYTGDRASDWIDLLLKKYELVIYVLGNHEFYYENYHNVKHWWAKAAEHRDNFVVLDDNTYVHNNTRFIGSTLWTPALRYGMNDYHVIRYTNRILEPKDTQMIHYQAVQFLEDALAQPHKGHTVVVTHHAPIPECVVPKFNGDSMNECFHAHLNTMIEENDIAYWLHGHMHDSICFDYHNTTIVCNPKGYVGYGANTGFGNPLTLEL